MLLINNIKLRLDEDESALKKKVEKKLRAKINSFEIYKKSLDARKTPIFVYSLLIDIDNEDKYINSDVTKYTKENLSPVYKTRKKTCIIVGYGPSGIFSAYRLLEAGFRVLIFEQGKRIKDRIIDVKKFFKEGVLNPTSNVQFGEGGAGTFSDAKLTTRIKNKYIDYILDIFVKHGAKSSIKYEHHPHVGTDKIRLIIDSISKYLISKGASIHYEEKFMNLLIEDNKIIGINTDKGVYKGDYVLLGIGHSAKDTINNLIQDGVYIEKKDISIGFRVEHPQSLIDTNQTNNLYKEANEYFLRYKDKKGVYSFCMCPGGIIIPAMSELHTIVTNGMSYGARNSGYANSAILIQKPKNEFIDGYNYLKTLEEKAYEFSSSYKALSQNIKDFMNNNLNDLIFSSTYPLGTTLFNFNDFFNEDDLFILKKAFLDFDKKINGFIDCGIIVGPETRSSCPIRIKRNKDTLESINMPNLYPMGEGGGYGGGIMSCALDGIRVANAIINRD